MVIQEEMKYHWMTSYTQECNNERESPKEVRRFWKYLILYSHSVMYIHSSTILLRGECEYNII